MVNYISMILIGCKENITGEGVKFAELLFVSQGQSFAKQNKDFFDELSDLLAKLMNKVYAADILRRHWPRNTYQQTLIQRSKLFSELVIEFYPFFFCQISWSSPGPSQPSCWQNWSGSLVRGETNQKWILTSELCEDNRRNRNSNSRLEFTFFFISDLNREAEILTLKFSLFFDKRQVLVCVRRWERARTVVWELVRPRGMSLPLKCLLWLTCLWLFIVVFLLIYIPKLLLLPQPFP